MVKADHQLKRALVAVIFVAMIAGGCATPVPERSPERTPPREGPGRAPPLTSGMSAAGQSLLTQSMSERRSGNYAQAAATLERALRIEPTEAAIWLELARVRLLEGNYTQAEQLGRKARTLATDGSIAADAERVIAEALRRQETGL